MQKVLLLALDFFMNPDDSILIIDEFENSLGLNSLNLLSTLLLSNRSKIQLIISSHHPYLINQIPINNWLICHRKGLNISIRSGKEIKEKYSNSLQQQFIQLINDPFYTNGIE
jgi:predicted ATPase